MEFKAHVTASVARFQGDLELGLLRLVDLHVDLQGFREVQLRDWEIGLRCLLLIVHFVMVWGDALQTAVLRVLIREAIR